MMDNNMMEMVRLLQQDNGIAEILQQPVYAQEGSDEPNVSQAEIIADLINLMRLDAKKMADANDVDIRITRMRPEQAAVLVQGLIKGDSLELVEVFNEIEEQREAVLEDVLDEDEYEQHLATKERALFSNEDREPETISPEARQALEQRKQQAEEMAKKASDNGMTPGDVPEPDSEVTQDGD
jgi:hypothetical protein